MSGNGTNPEPLFAVGCSSCFLSVLKIEAAKRKLRFPVEGAVDAEVDLGLTVDVYMLQARLNISLPGLARAIAGGLAEAAYQICPCSRLYTATSK